MTDANRSEHLLHRGKYLELCCRGHWEFVRRPGISGIVVIVAVTDDQCILLIEQYRPPLDARVIELPAGLAGDLSEQDESLVTAARRELLEETGYQSEGLQLLTEGPPSPGCSDEIISFFLATKVHRVHAGGGDDSEDITVHCVPLVEVHGWLEQRRKKHGLLVDPKTYTGLYFALRHCSGGSAGPPGTRDPAPG